MSGYRGGGGVGIGIGSNRQRPEEKKYARVLYNYTATYNDELSLRLNDVVTIISFTTSAGAGWWEARLRGKTGKIPDNFVEIIEEPKGLKARALWDHYEEEQTGNYLNFNTGEVITVLKQEESGWWVGYHNEQIGRFPYNYVEITEGIPVTSNENKSFHDLIDLLSEPEHVVIKALGAVADPTITEQLAKDLVAVFETNGQALRLIQSMISFEVHITSSAGTLFRGNSLANHLMVSYARSNGKQYMINTLKPLIDLVRNSGKNYEIDPAKIKSGESISENTANLQGIATTFMGSIVQSLNAVPPAIRYICSCLQATVGPKFPESKTKSVGGFFFLRFLCPAIVSPEGFNIVNRQAITPETRRALILISKILQNIANGVQFGQKEQFMVSLNSLCTSQTPIVNNFFDSLSSLREEVSEVAVKLPEADLCKTVGKVHLAISNNLTKLDQKLTEMKSPETYSQLIQLLKALPPPAGASSGPRQNTIETPLEDRRKSAVFVLNNFLQGKQGAGDTSSSPSQSSSASPTVGTSSSSSSTAQSADYTQLSGWLSKKGARGMVKGFKKRWFTLQKDSRLVYFETQDESKEKGHIDLRKVTSIGPCGAFGKQPRVTTFEFRLKTVTREYVLVASNEREMWYWINGLNNVRQKNLMKSMNLSASGGGGSD